MGGSSSKSSIKTNLENERSFWQNIELLFKNDSSSSNRTETNSVVSSANTIQYYPRPRTHDTLITSRTHNERVDWPPSDFHYRHSDGHLLHVRNAQFQPQSSGDFSIYDEHYFPQASQVIIHSQNSSIKKSYICTQLNNFSEEFMKVKGMITNKQIKVISIERIENSYLRKNYNLMKLKKKENYDDLEEVLLFHGTSQKNVNSICENNFNWRLNGQGTGHKFGKGISFSCNAKYASHYSKDPVEKVMFVVNVLIGNKCLGNVDMDLPPAGFDTTSKLHDNIVIVKYEDNEFYPAYKINFLDSSPNTISKNSYSRRNNFRSLRTSFHYFDDYE